MVTQIKGNDEALYKCDKCGGAYRKKEIAEKCQRWCETYEGSCNIEYVKYAVSLDNEA